MYNFKPRVEPWTGDRRRAFFGWDGSYNYGRQALGIKQAGEPIRAEPIRAEPISATVPELNHVPEYSRQDEATAREHLKTFNLYTGGRQNLELIKETARAIARGEDAQAIDFKSLQSRDKPISEALEDERTACMYQDGIW